MKTAGVIVEYNPFHNGHLYHLNETKRTTGADIVIAVMSGSFLQRGEPSLVDKWTRTRMALMNGVDIVIELPYVYATQKAEIFARGAVSLLSSLGVDELCFGSESGTIEEFLDTISFINNHEQHYNERIKYYMGKGNSYPKATSLAFQSLDGHEQVLDLSQPNNILGYHYVKAIDSQKSPMKPSTILRTKAGYHDQNLADTKIASATGIRHELITKGSSLKSVNAYVPPATFDELNFFQKTYKTFHAWHRVFHHLRYKLLTASKEELSLIYEAEEGLENRLVTVAKTAHTFPAFMEAVKTKRYTWTRIQRFALHILTNTSKEEMKPVLSETAPYIRLLGMSQAGRSYLNEKKGDLPVPLVSNINQFEHPFLSIERRVSQVYALGFSGEHQETFLQKEHKSAPIMI
ncbi:nucleotidyltransferase [Pseudalkalibacillus hwajinpoensis]|uniref:nucleotidyltransferase n=1 Tax=Guptibacillus hwajinpoensis TaxID=208199 RepID=UPI00325A76F2